MFTLHIIDHTCTIYTHHRERHSQFHSHAHSHTQLTFESGHIVRVLVQLQYCSQHLLDTRQSMRGGCGLVVQARLQLTDIESRGIEEGSSCVCIGGGVGIMVACVFKKKRGHATRETSKFKAWKSFPFK